MDVSAGKRTNKFCFFVFLRITTRLSPNYKRCNQRSLKPTLTIGQRWRSEQVSPISGAYAARKFFESLVSLLNVVSCISLFINQSENRTKITPPWNEKRNAYKNSYSNAQCFVKSTIDRASLISTIRCYTFLFLWKPNRRACTCCTCGAFFDTATSVPLHGYTVQISSCTVYI